MNDQELSKVTKGKPDALVVTRTPPYRYHEADFVRMRPVVDWSKDLFCQLSDRASAEWYGGLFHHHGESRSVRQERLAYRMFRAAQMIVEAVEVDEDRCGGIPVIRGTRFTVAQMIAQIADGDSVAVLADEFDLNKEDVVKCLHAISIALDRPFTS